MRAPIVSILALVFVSVALAGDLQFQPSKITYAKKRGWEALASKWMNSNELKKYVEDQKTANKQMIFVDYNGAAYRGLFTDKIKYQGWYYMERFSEKEMARDIAEYKAKGFEPSYVYRNAGGYTAVFVTPEQMAAARKLLDELGIGPAVVKE